jgi:hypothetical protein
MRATFLAICTAFICATATPATPSDHADAASFQTASNMICGSGGCAPVRTKAEKHRKFQTLGHG